MVSNINNPEGIGLERSCKVSASEYIYRKDLADGLELMEVWFQGYSYHRHRHDTYAICLTRVGIQNFGYRGRSQVSTPGNVVILHPDEMHDGHAGNEEGLGYQMLYIAPGLIFEAARAICGKNVSLPFIYPPVLKSRKLLQAIISAFNDTTEPLAIDSLITELVEGLTESAPQAKSIPKIRYQDHEALNKARMFLEAEKNRVVNSCELEKITGLSRFELARQFRLRFGTSPYRYMQMRRLDFAKSELSKPISLAEVALNAGFSDQAHFTRIFKSGFGLTPGIYRRLIAH